jgi:hypothetical protein
MAHLTNSPLIQHSPLIAHAVHPSSSPDQFFHFLWYSFSIHEALNIGTGLPIRPPPSRDSLLTLGMPAPKAHEYTTYKHALPHLPQVPYPSD